jgi:hypothetical protein
MRQLLRRRWLRRAVLLTVPLLVAACGGGGGGGGGSPSGPAQPGITFTASGSPSADTVYLARNAETTAYGLVLDVMASNVTNLFAIGFELHYPSSVLSYTKVTEGPFLSNSGNISTSLQLSERQKGVLTIGLTRLGNVSGRNGSGRLMTLRFAAAGSGSGVFSYQNQAAYDANIRQTGLPIFGFQFLAGSVTVRQ